MFGTPDSGAFDSETALFGASISATSWLIIPPFPYVHAERPICFAEEYPLRTFWSLAIYSLSQRHKPKHGQIPKIMPAGRQALHQTKLCAKRTRMPCDEAEATRASGFSQSTPRIMAKATDALIGTLA